MAGLDGYNDPRVKTLEERINKRAQELQAMRETAKVGSDGVTLEFDATEKDKWSKMVTDQRTDRESWRGILEEVKLLEEVSVPESELEKEKSLENLPTESEIAQELRRLRGDGNYQEKKEKGDTPGAFVSHLLEKMEVAGRHGSGLNFFDKSIDSRKEVAFTFTWGKGGASFKREKGESFKSFLDIKSLYTAATANPAQAASAPFTGYAGYICGLEFDPTVAIVREPATCVENLVTRKPTSGNRIIFTREVAETNNAAAVFETIYRGGGIAAPGGIGAPEERIGTKPESFVGFSNVTVDITKVATHLKLSNEVMQDCPSLMETVDMLLMRMVKRKRRQLLLSGNGTAPNPRGIYFQPGVLTGTFRGAPRGTVNDTIPDFVRRAITDLQLQGYLPTGVMMNPLDLEKVALLKDTQGNYLFPDCVTGELWCVPVCGDADNPSGQMSIGEFLNNWIEWMREEVTVRMGYIGNQFIENAVTLVAETRFGTGLYEPLGVFNGSGIV